MLKNKADLLAHFFQRGRFCIQEFFTEDPDAAFLRRSQRADQGEHGGFAGTGRAGDDNDFTLADFDPHIEQDLFFEFALAVGVVQAFDFDWRCCTHQNTSAGSSRRTLRTAISAEMAHMASVIRKTVIARSCVM